MKKKFFYFGLTCLVILFSLVFLHFGFNRPPDRSFFLTPVCQLPSDEKIVALTFDDGPSTVRTMPLLKVLEKHNVKATFFMNGVRMAQNWGIAESVAKGGHLIGNHSYDHVRLIFKSPAEVERQIDKTDSLILKTGNNNLRYFRPPYGDKMLVLPYLLKKKNKLLVNFDVACPSQYDLPMNEDQVVREAIENCHPGSIIVLHDGWSTDRQPFISAVDRIITELKSQGYRFVRLDEKI